MKIINIIYLLSIPFLTCLSNDIPSYFNVDFNLSMKSGGRYDCNYSMKIPHWHKVKTLYDKYIKENINYQETPLIPKKIHQIWLGGPLPEKYKKFQQSWIENHPDWEYKLWTDKDIEELNLINIKYYKNGKNLGEKSDIARLEILYRFGGLYIDTDFECLRPFDILHHCCEFYAGCDAINTFVVYNGLIGSKPNHPILKRSIENIPTSTHHRETMFKTGPHFLTGCILQELMSCDQPWIIFPTTYFYPWPCRHRNNNKREEIEKWIKPESFAIHHWYVSWG